MTKIIILASMLSAGVVAGAGPSQARQISVWGNTFTTDDGAGVGAPTRQFNAMVEHPEMYATHGRTRHIAR